MRCADSARPRQLGSARVSAIAGDSTSPAEALTDVLIEHAAPPRPVVVDSKI